MLSGLDTNVLIDTRLLGIEPLLARVLDGEGWTTTFVDAEFGDPLEQARGGAASLFPFLEFDPVDARLLPQIERDQIAIMGRRRAGRRAWYMWHVTLGPDPSYSAMTLTLSASEGDTMSPSGARSTSCTGRSA